METTTYRTRNFLSKFHFEDLNHGKLTLEDVKNNTTLDSVIYTGKIQRILQNGISDCYKVDLKPGHKLYICKNQYIDFEDFEKRKVLNCHFGLEAKNTHTSGCTCGSCGYNWKFKETKCNCEQQPPLVANEDCVIQ
jgi:hypothetical protein